jgi:hypothetical protein
MSENINNPDIKSSFRTTQPIQQGVEIEKVKTADVKKEIKITTQATSTIEKSETGQIPTKPYDPTSPTLTVPQTVSSNVRIEEKLFELQGGISDVISEYLTIEKDVSIPFYDAVNRAIQQSKPLKTIPESCLKGLSEKDRELVLSGINNLNNSDEGQGYLRAEKSPWESESYMGAMIQIFLLIQMLNGKVKQKEAENFINSLKNITTTGELSAEKKVILAKIRTDECYTEAGSMIGKVAISGLGAVRTGTAAISETNIYTKKQQDLTAKIKGADPANHPDMNLSPSGIYNGNYDADKAKFDQLVLDKTENEKALNLLEKTGPATQTQLQIIQAHERLVESGLSGLGAINKSTQAVHRGKEEAEESILQTQINLENKMIDQARSIGDAASQNADAVLRILQDAVATGMRAASVKSS